MKGWVMGRFVSRGVCRDRNVGDFGIISTLFGGVWCRIKCLLCIDFKEMVSEGKQFDESGCVSHIF